MVTELGCNNCSGTTTLSPITIATFLINITAMSASYRPFLISLVVSSRSVSERSDFLKHLEKIYVLKMRFLTMYLL